MSKTTTEPRIYVASLSDYNNGSLHGVWIDLDGKDADDVRAEIATMLRESKYPNVRVECPDCDGADLSGTVPSAEEWAIHDSEGLGDVSEHADIDELVTRAEAISEHGEAFLLYRDNIGDVATVEGFQDAYHGAFRSVEDYAEQYLDDTGAFSGAPDLLKNYFDYEKFAHDLEVGGDIWTAQGESGDVHIFWTC